MKPLGFPNSEDLVVFYSVREDRNWLPKVTVANPGFATTELCIFPVLSSMVWSKGSKLTCLSEVLLFGDFKGKV